MMRLVVLALALCLSFGRALANPIVDTVAILSYGTYTADLVDRIARPDDPSGFANSLTGHRLIERTDRICARLGLRFGITIRPEGRPAGTPVLLHIVTNYPSPGIVNDKGKAFKNTKFPWLSTIGEPTSIVFTFDEPWELAHGTWSFSIEFNGRPIGERSFTVMTTCEIS